VIEQNTLSLNKEDCELIESKLQEGTDLREVLSEQIKPMYQGDLDDLEGIEIPSDYWYFVSELTKNE
jgi:hypothetical protein